MSVTFGLAVYFVVWWIVLFAVLPIGVRTQAEDGAIVPGTPESAPTSPRFWLIILLTTALATVVFGMIWATITWRLIDFELVPTPLPR